MRDHCVGSHELQDLLMMGPGKLMDGHRPCTVFYTQDSIDSQLHSTTCTLNTNHVSPILIITHMHTTYYRPQGAPV